MRQGTDHDRAPNRRAGAGGRWQRVWPRWAVPTRPVRRALGEVLPPEIAAAAVELITGPLLDDPRRLGRQLVGELAGIWSARLGREWRVLYEIDEQAHAVIVLDIRHRASACRPR